MTDSSPPSEHPSHLTHLPWWARALDVVGIALLLVGLSVIVTGGFREWTPLGRLSVTSWSRPIVLAFVILLVRHWRRPSPSLPHRVFAALNRWRRSPEAAVVGPVFLATRVGVLIVGFLGVVLIGYEPNARPWRVYDNDFLDLPARWDTGWYLGVALEGYAWQRAPADQQQNITFFPLYPMLMRYGALFAARQIMWVGVAISFVAFFLALVYLFRLARASIGDDAAGAAVAFLAAYPFALFYSAAYTEALFLLTIVAACYHFERDELWRAAIWGLLAGLTRPNGCLLSIVLALIAVRRPHREIREIREIKAAQGDHGKQISSRSTAWPTSFATLAKRMASASAPGIGMLIYSTYIYFLTGNPLQWAAQNAAWGRVYRPIDDLVDERIEFVRQFGFYDYASSRGLDLMHAVTVLFVLATVWPVFRRFGLPYAAMILLIVVPPLAMGGLLSIGRVTAVAFPMFLWLGAAVPANHRTGWLIAFGMLQGLCAIAFFTWRPLY